jgi:hypothetical protein
MGYTEPAMRYFLSLPLCSPWQYAAHESGFGRSQGLFYAKNSSKIAAGMGKQLRIEFV